MSVYYILFGAFLARGCEREAHFPRDEVHASEGESLGGSLLGD